MISASRSRWAAAQSASSAAAAALRGPLPIPSLAPKPPRRSTLKAAAIRAARRVRFARQGFEIEGPKLPLAEQESLLRAEIAELERKVESTTQAESSKKATEQLPPLDELTLEQLYHALTLPEPLTPAEERLLLLDQRRSVKRSLGIEPPLSEAQPALPDPERVELRMRALESRIASISLANDAELAQQLTVQRNKLAERVSLLIADSEDQAGDKPKESGRTGDVVPATPQNSSLTQHDFHELMSDFAARGDIENCQKVLRQMKNVGFMASAETYHWLVKGYLTAGKTLLAMQILTDQESLGTPASQSTYTLMINHLINHPSASRAVQAAAWSFFYHMRLNAHHIPDAPMYALMLHACAKGIPQPSEVAAFTRNTPAVVRAVRRMRKAGTPDAERALDLFREMTTVYNVKPNAEIYNNLILACCRSGEKKYYHEAFRLLREMLQKSEDAARAEGSLAGILWEEGESAHHDKDGRRAGKAKASTLRFTPDRYTFHAFLQGCARHKDLARARWVLAEMVRAAGYYQRAIARLGPELERRLAEDDTLVRRLKELDDCRPSAETLTHIFFTYAAYVPPLRPHDFRHIGDSETAEQKDGSGDAGKVDASGADKDGKALKIDENGQAVAKTEKEGVERVLDAVHQSRADVATVEDNAATAFTLDLPKTSTEVLRELRALMARIIADHEQAVSGNSSAAQSPADAASPFSTVQPTVHLLNAYMSAMLAHTSPERRPSLFADAIQPLPPSGQAVIGDEADTSESTLEYGATGPERYLYARLGLRPNSRTLSIGLDALASVSTKLVGRPSKEIAPQLEYGWRDLLDMGNRLWADWRRLDEEEYRLGKESPAAVAKRRERAWAARIRIQSKFDALDAAVETLFEFTQLYPPRKASTENPMKVDNEEVEESRVDEEARKRLVEELRVPEPSPILYLVRSGGPSSGPLFDLGLPKSLSTGMGPLSIPPLAYNILLATGKVDRSSASTAATPSPDLSMLDDFVPDVVRPGLTFTELELLHHRLVARGGKASRRGINLVNWAARAYEAQKKATR